MKRLCLALAVAALLLLVAGVGTATANPPELQSADQLVGNAMALAGGAEGTAQEEPTTEDSAAAAPAPDEGSSLDQSNDATSAGTAGNLNAAKQDADQKQDGSGVQAIGQSAKNDQDATAAAFTVQEKPENTNVPVSVLGKGHGGDVTQSNDASSDASAGNLNLTSQEAEQDQGSGGGHDPYGREAEQDQKSGDDHDCKCEGGGTQAIGQSAKNDQDATALAKTIQVKPSNTNISVRVLSPGDDGNVTQTNTASSDATAFNLNATKQDADQKQDGDSCKCTGGEQAIGQSADSEQDATALAKTVQEKPSNTNISVRVLSPGDDGDVTQSNTATSDATAGNINLTKQDADQKQDGSGLQAIGQSADNDQKALAAALTVQEKPSNKNISVRVLSPGDGGSVTQSNTASSDATAFNLNATKQDADQKQDGDSCKCTSGEQAIGQSAKSDQDAKALAATFQVKPSNTNTSVRVLSKGDDGDVTQSNDASSSAFAGNLNLTKQDADQKQDGDSCKCAGGIQAIGQSAKSDQEAKALAATFQVKPSNTNTSVRVLSKGDDGDVTQSNDASSSAFAGNLNLTKQDADQKQDGSGIQAIGQFAKNDQDAFALGTTFQIGASNENTPVRVGSKGDGGSVTQSNTATSDAVAANLNFLEQDADQKQDSSCKCHEAFGIQAIGQFAKNDQKAVALAATFQIKPSNSNTPVRVGSKGDDGDVTQSNTASSLAKAFNVNLTKQDADQKQDTSCKCHEAFGIQAIGQLSESDQFSAALAATFQLGASNKSAPVRVNERPHGDDKGHYREPVMPSTE